MVSPPLPKKEITYLLSLPLGTPLLSDIEEESRPSFAEKVVRLEGPPPPRLRRKILPLTWFSSYGRPFS